MKKPYFILSVIAGILIITASFYGFFLLQQRAGLPLEIKQAVQEHRLIQIDDTKIEKEKDLEFILSGRNEGESATFFVQTDGNVEVIHGNLIAYYSQYPFPVLSLVIGFFCIVIAFVVFSLRPQELRARLFYWCMLAFSFAVIVNGGFHSLREEWTSYIPGMLFYIFYPLSAALLFHFSWTFIRVKFKSLSFLLYLPAFLIIVLLEYRFLRATLTSSIEVYREYQSTVLLNRFYIIAYILLTLLILVLGFKKARLEEHRAQIKWILYGLVLGIGPFILLYQLPIVLIEKPIITEEFSGVFFIFVPIALAISIIRFKLMNIELVINRSLVYAILTIFTVGIYLLSVQIIHALLSESLPVHEGMVPVIAALTAAVAFHPARKKIQNFVDKSFFRLSYDYRKSILSFNERAHRMARLSHLVHFFLSKTNKTIPLEYLGLMVYSSQKGTLEVNTEIGGKKDLESLAPLILGKRQILARRQGVHTELGMDFSAEEWMEENNLNMIIPVPFGSMEFTGFVALSKKKSGAKFTHDDIELLLTLTETLALNLERIRLLEEVIYERAEKEKFDELNRLKTEFISNVSHEIRTPMSSIQGMSEILQQGKLREKRKQEELVNLMADECARLSRFLHNILDYSKIEQNVQAYDFQDMNVCPVVKQVLKMFDYRLKSLGFSLHTRLPQKPILLKIDPDSVKQALTNLIDNAIKYSSVKRDIRVSIIEKNREVEIRIQDKGVGIPDQEQTQIFRRFYRMEEAQRMAPKGVGLGLKIVKHIMDAHRGKIRVQSKRGKGSTFALVFPRP